MIKRTQELFVQDILDAINDIQNFVAGMSADGFFADKKTQAAVIYRFQIIGEAAKNLSADLKRKYPQIVWKKITGIRNILVHEYFGVQLKTIWDTIKNDLPDLKEKITQIMKDSDFGRQKKLLR